MVLNHQKLKTDGLSAEEKIPAAAAAVTRLSKEWGETVDPPRRTPLIVWELQIRSLMAGLLLIREEQFGGSVTGPHRPLR
jgi:hypothetical protein